MKKIKLIRTSTIPASINNFCKGLLRDLQENEGMEVVAVASPGKELSEIAEREGVKTYSVAMQRHISPLKDLKSLRNMIRLLRREKPDMIHSITPKAGLISMLAGWICRVPVRLHTFTGLIFPTSKGLKRKILILTDRLTCACATHIHPEGEGVRRDLLNNRITRKPLRVLGHGNIRGIDLDRFNPQNADIIKEAEPLRKEGVFTFLFIGRLVRDKGINELVEAFERLSRECHDTRLLLVGRLEQEIDPIEESTISAINNNEYIEAVGEQKDVRPWLLAADAFVFPSYREGLPNVVIEAGAMNLPSIVTDINGSREIIRHGENGIVIPSKNADSIYEAMKFFLENPKAVERMGRDARPLIASRYEQSYVRGCLKDFYKEIISKTIRE